jgi:nucleotide-binding universal stress UspA family protein
MIKNILVPLDGSSLAEGALPAASALSKATGAKILLIHVIEKNPPANIHGQTHLQSEEDAKKYLEEIAKQFLSDKQEVECHVHNEPVDRVAESITNHIVEFESDILVMCSHGNGGLRDMLYGNIAQQIVANKKAPVLIIHPDQQPTDMIIKFEKILIPVDGLPEHEQGLDFAVYLAKILHASLFLFLVVPTPSTLEGEQAAVSTLLPISSAFALEELESDAEGYLCDHIDRLCAQGIEVNGEIRRGNPIDEIDHFVRENSFDLVVIGTHGKSGVDAFWSASKASRIISRITSPVLLVPVKQ